MSVVKSGNRLILGKCIMWAKGRSLRETCSSILPSLRRRFKNPSAMRRSRGHESGTISFILFDTSSLLRKKVSERGEA